MTITEDQFRILRKATTQVTGFDPTLKSNAKAFVNARVALIHIARDDHRMSFPAIGRYLQQNHATIIHAYEKSRPTRVCNDIIARWNQLKAEPKICLAPRVRLPGTVLSGLVQQVDDLAARVADLERELYGKESSASESVAV